MLCVTLLMLVMVIQEVNSEYCPSYNDSSGVIQSGFYCPQELNVVRPPKYYCCSYQTKVDQFCCEDYTLSVYNYTYSSGMMWAMENAPILAIPVMVGGFWFVGACIGPGSAD